MTGAWKRVLLLMSLAAFVIASASCGGGNSGGGAAEPDPNNPTRVTVGYLPIFVYAPFFIAIEKGYFREQGIEVELKALQGGGEILTQVVAGNLDAGAGGIGPAAMNLASAVLARGESKLPFIIVAPLHLEQPPLLTSLVTSPRAYESGRVRSTADLRGKKVATNDKGAATAYWIALALEKANLTFRDLAGGEPEAIPFGAMVAALERGDIDAAVLGEPLLSSAVRAGSVRVLDDAFLHGEPGTSVFVSRAWAERNPRLAEGYVTALIRAFRDLQGDGWLRDENLRIVAKYTLATGRDVTQADIDALKGFNRPYYDPNGVFDIERLSKQQAYYLQYSRLLTYTRPVDMRLMIDTNYAEKAVSALGTAR
jgi:NitT/TauT family transport system substrate-binding protein